MAFDLLILSDIRFIREGLAEVLARDGTFQIAGIAADIEHACTLVKAAPPSVILIDTSLPHGIAAVAALRKSACNAKVVAFALTETETEVIAWAQAGIAGYIPRNTALGALVSLLSSIVRGEQVCPTRIAASLLRWIGQHAGNSSRLKPASGRTPLTPREHEIARLMSVSLSNKEIARKLGISVATTKSHVHNILAKLGISTRGQAAQHLLESYTVPSHVPPVYPSPQSSDG